MKCLKAAFSFEANPDGERTTLTNLNGLNDLIAIGRGQAISENHSLISLDGLMSLCSITESFIWVEH